MTEDLGNYITRPYMPRLTGLAVRALPELFHKNSNAQLLDPKTRDSIGVANI